MLMLGGAVTGGLLGLKVGMPVALGVMLALLVSAAVLVGRGDLEPASSIRGERVVSHGGA
jgi:hypothetical protein